MTVKDILPGLTKSWNFEEKNQDFLGDVGTLERLYVEVHFFHIPPLFRPKFWLFPLE